MFSARQGFTTIGTGPSGNYWIGTYGDLATQGNGLGPSITNSNGDTFVVSGFGTTILYVYKIDNQGVIQWYYRYNSSLLGGGTIRLDSSSNLYICGFTSLGNDDFLVLKLNSSGVFQWERRLGGSTTQENSAGIDIDSSGNVYVTGVSGPVSGTGDQLSLFKYNSSGTLQWQVLLSGTGDCSGGDISVDNSTNSIVVCGNRYVTGTTSSVFLLKYDFSGNLIWQQEIIYPSFINTFVLASVSIDSTGNIYTTGGTVIGSTFSGVLFKYNSSGTLLWQRLLGPSQFGRCVSIDNYDNVYVYSSTGTPVTLLSFDSSGTLLWQRDISNGASMADNHSLSFDSSNNLYANYNTIYSPGTPNSFGTTFKIPSDGSILGTYPAVSGITSITFSAGTANVTTSTLTSTTSTLTSSVSTFTSSNITATRVSRTPTSYLTIV